MTIKNTFVIFVFTLSFEMTGFAQPNNTQAPITGIRRVHWTVCSTIGPASLAAGVFTSGLRTALNHPEEYGPHWTGFAKRYGLRLTSVGASNGIEAGLGALWNEDPRYVRSGKSGLLDRVKYAGRMTFVAKRPNGSTAPAYARFIAVPSSNFISNSWRVKTDRSVADALARTAVGFTGRFLGNLVEELW